MISHLTLTLYYLKSLAEDIFLLPSSLHIFATLVNKSIMASTAATPRIYPKRKRADISYHESGSEETEVDDRYDTRDAKRTATTRKVCQSILAVFANMPSKNLLQKLKTSHTALSTKPLPKRKIFPFTSLPAELRNQIYALALTDVNTIFLISITKSYRRTVERLRPGFEIRPDGLICDNPYLYRTHSEAPVASLAPNLLLLNQAIYAETQPILYAGNSFAVDDTKVMHAFLANIGPKNRATISDLTLHGWGETGAQKALHYPAFTLLAGAVNLTRLYINCKIGYHDPKSQAKQLYRDGFHWLEAVGVAKGKFDAAIDVIEIEFGYLHVYSYGRVMNRGKGSEEKKEEFRAELRRLLSECGGGRRKLQDLRFAQ